MPSLSHASSFELFLRAQSALTMSQQEIGAVVNVSRRTVVRWTRARSLLLLPSNWAALAAKAFPVDPALAAALAERGGHTLQSLGLVPAPSPGAPSPPAPATAEPVVSPADLGQLVVYAAAEAANLPPQAIRPALLAAFERAASVGLSLDQVRAALAAPGRARAQ